MHACTFHYMLQNVIIDNLISGVNYTYPNCTVPWHQSMLGINDYNETEAQVCNDTAYWSTYRLDYDFMEKANSGKNKKCLGKSYIATYVKHKTYIYR